MRIRADRGQALPLIALVVVLMGVVALLLGELGGRAVARAQARTAADAAALAGAAEGRAAAEEVAAVNGAVVVRFEVVGTDTIVQVRVGDALATARARRAGAALGRI